MTGKEVVVAAVIRAKQGRESDLERELRALIPPTRVEAGCINYDLHRSVDDRAVFLFHETWKSREDLERHLKTDHIASFMRNVETILDQPPDIRLWERIA